MNGTKDGGRSTIDGLHHLQFFEKRGFQEEMFAFKVLYEKHLFLPVCSNTISLCEIQQFSRMET